MCRTELPPGPEKLNEDAARLFIEIERRVKRGEASWDALKIEEQQQIDKSIEFLTQAAEQGYAKAQLNLGSIYFRGQGVAQNEVEAAWWYRKAAEQEHAGAQYNLGVMHENGRGVAKSNVEAVQWYRKSAEQRDAVAQFILGNTYYKGKGVAQSDAEAVRWWRKAAEQGEACAQCNLGMLLFDGGVGVNKNLAESFKYLTLAAASSDSEAAEKFQGALKIYFPNGAPGKAPRSSTPACTRCGIAPPVLKACSRCKVAVYCSKECQSMHWKAGHKKDCHSSLSSQLLDLR
jgi:TPR repeat protein